MLFLRRDSDNYNKLMYKFCRKPVTSNKSHKSNYFNLNHKYQIHIKKLRYFFKNNSGRNSSGRTVIYTKSVRKLKTMNFKINYSYRDKSLFFVASFILTKFKHKLLALVFFASGNICYVQTTSKFKLFEFFKFKGSKPNQYIKRRKKKKINYSTFTKTNLFSSIKLLVKDLPKNKPVSLLEIKPLVGIQYVRSPGSKALIRKMDSRISKSIVILPSGVRKVFSTHSIGSEGAVDMHHHKYFSQRNAGYWRLLGKKPKNRGVARNPVDHPHGGRTKAIKHQRTPWGKTTKKK